MEFLWILKRFVRFIKWCVKEMINGVWMGKQKSNTFPMKIEMKTRRLFNIALILACKYDLTMSHSNQERLKLDGTSVSGVN